MKKCGYRTGVDSVLRDQIVLGFVNPIVRENFLHEKDFLLEKACEKSPKASSARSTPTTTGDADGNNCGRCQKKNQCCVANARSVAV